MRGPLRACRSRRPTGFTIVELLVVIAVLGLLISLVTALASKVLHQQRVRNTKQIMVNVSLALEQFATENPLRAIYDKKGKETFGKYPAYQLANWESGNSVPGVLEKDHPFSSGSDVVPATIRDRLAWDLSGTGSPALDQWVRIPRSADSNDDIRALHAYLAVYTPGALQTIPEGQLKPLYSASADRDYVNPTGTGPPVGQPDNAWLDVLGIHDAWGVPLDYMLYVKCEWQLPPGQSLARFVVTERKPVLRSRGIQREAYDAWVQSNPDPTLRPRELSPREDWIFSEELPKPWFGGTGSIADDGTFGFSGAQANGWVRAVADGEDYAYRPGEEPP